MCLALNIFRPFNSHWATKLSTHRKFKAIYNLLKWILRVQHCSKGFWHILFLTRVSRQSFSLSLSLSRCPSLFCSIGSDTNRIGSTHQVAEMGESCKERLACACAYVHARVRVLLGCYYCGKWTVGWQSEWKWDGDVDVVVVRNVRFLFLFCVLSVRVPWGVWCAS